MTKHTKTEIKKFYFHLKLYANSLETAKTNVEAVFVSGDAVDHVCRQAITTLGTGCMPHLM